MANTTPIKEGFKCAHAHLKDKARYDTISLNLQPALEMSLKTRAYIEDFVESFVSDFGKFNSLEKNSIMEYLAIADLLKRQVWAYLKKALLKFINSEDFFTTPLSAKDQRTLRVCIAGGENDWKTVIKNITLLIGTKSMQVCKVWESLARGNLFKDEMFIQRFGELELLCKKNYGADANARSSPGGLLRIGIATALEFPMGMLLAAPELLEEAGDKVDLTTIKTVFKANSIPTSSTYAAQDIITLKVVENITQPHKGQEIGDYHPTPFPVDMFGLDGKKRLVFKAKPFDHALEHAKESDLMEAVLYAAGQQMINAEEGGVTNTQAPWMGCPFLFAKLMPEFGPFLEHVLARIVEVQDEHQ